MGESTQHTTAVQASAQASGPQACKTRSAPLCKDCRHFYAAKGGMCNHPHAPVSLVTGTPDQSAAQSRNWSVPANVIESLRKRNKLVIVQCGPDGTLFEPRDGVADVSEGALEISQARNQVEQDLVLHGSEVCTHVSRDQSGVGEGGALSEAAVNRGASIVENVVDGAGRSNL
jgi:hypothetical protein